MYMTKEQLKTILEIVEEYDTDNGTIKPKSDVLEGLISDIKRFDVYDSYSVEVTIKLIECEMAGGVSSFTYSDGYLMYDDGR